MQYNEILCNPTQNKIHNSSENHLTQSTNTNWYFQMAVGTKSGTLGPSEDLRGAQKGILRPKQALFACFWPFSWTGWFQIGYNSAGWAGNSAPMLWTPQKPIFETKNVHHKIWPWKFRDRGQIALFGPPGTQKGPNTRSKCVVGMSPTQADQSGAVGTKSGLPGPSDDLRGTQKGHFGPKRALLGPPGAQKGPDTRSKCVVSMSLTQTGQSGAVGTKSAPPGPSEDLRGPQKGLSRPKRALLGAVEVR